jgi:pimeloyl-ACP methyl ester carboxylesterase
MNTNTDPPDLACEIHSGRGPYLLLVHGLLSSRAQWELNVRALSEVARPVVVELFGHGRSPSPHSGEFFSPAHYVSAFERLRETLGVERWLLCGQSLGAALTLRYALDHPDRIIAQVFTNSNSALAPADWTDATRPAMQALALAVSEQGRDAIDRLPIHPRRASNLPAAVRNELIADSLLHSPDGIAKTGLHTVLLSSVRDRIAENRVPTLLVRGEREKRFAEQAAFALESMPQLESIDLPAGHAVNIEAAADFNAATTRFFARTAG